MSKVEQDYKFASSHEWVKDNGDGTVTIGISNHAQGLLGDVVFVELPEEEDSVTAGEGFSLVESVKAASDVYAPVSGEGFSLVESVKAASDVYAPVSGEVIAINEDLEDSPELVNSAPFTDGWIAKVKLSNPEQLDDLLDSDAYYASVDE